MAARPPPYGSLEQAAVAAGANEAASQTEAADSGPQMHANHAAAAAGPLKGVDVDIPPFFAKAGLSEAAAPASAAEAAFAGAAPADPPLSDFTLLVARRYILVVASTDRLQRRPLHQQCSRVQQHNVQQQQIRECILHGDGLAWRRLHSLLLIHKQPTLQQREHMKQYFNLHQQQQQQQQQQHCFHRPPTWERIGKRLMTTEEAEECLKNALLLLLEEPQQQVRCAGLVGFLPLVCGFHLVAAAGAQPAARLLQHHTVHALDGLLLLPLFFDAVSAQEAAAFCCSIPPTIDLLYSLQQHQHQQHHHHHQQQSVYLQQVQDLCRGLAGLSLNSGAAAAAAAAAAAEDAKHRASVSAYHADRGFYFCRTLCINLSLQQLAARRAAARAAAAAAAAAELAGTGVEASAEACTAARSARFHELYITCELHSEDSSDKQQQQQENEQQQQGCSSRWRRSPLHREECRFLWNRELLSLLLQRQQPELISEGFFVLLLHGSVQQQVLHTQGVLLQLLTISRRSASFAGPRYRKRGLNDAGDAANEVEVEFICQAAMPSRAAAAAAAVEAAATATAASPDTPAALRKQVLLRGGGAFEAAVASHVIARGSAPLLWCQDTTVIPSRPRIQRRMTDVNCSAIRRHMAGLLQRYGAPLLLLNLLRSSPRLGPPVAVKQTAPRALSAAAASPGEQQQQGLRAAAEAAMCAFAENEENSHSEEAPAAATVAEQEAYLGEEYRRAVAALNAELPAAVQLRFAAVDIEAARRTNPSGASAWVGALAANTLRELQFFASNDLWGLLPAQLQRGVCRLNCLDSLDRTNELQLHLHRAFVLAFMEALPAALVIDHALDQQVLRAIAALTDSSGDDLALQYGGSVAHRKRLEPLAWAAQLPRGSSPGDDQRGNNRRVFSTASSTSNSSSWSQLPPPPLAASFVADETAAAEEPRINSSSNKPSSGLLSSALTVLQGVSSAFALQWVGGRSNGGLMLPLLPGLSTSLQRRYSNVLEDGRKQQALNIWFCLSSPFTRPNLRTPIWRVEDSNDLYTHHNFLEPSFSPKDWWVLPLQRFFNGMRASLTLSHCSSSRCCCEQSAEHLQGGAATSVAGAATDAKQLLGCCGRSCQPASTRQFAAAVTAADAFLRSRGPPWVLEFLPPPSAGTAPSSSSSSSTVDEPEDGEQCLLDVFTYAPWRRQAAKAAAAAAAAAAEAAVGVTSGSLTSEGTEPLVAAAQPAAATATEATTGTEVNFTVPHAPAAAAAATTDVAADGLDHQQNAERIDDRTESNSSCRKSSPAHAGLEQGLEALAYVGRFSLAMLLPSLIDSETAAARAMQCCYALLLREQEQRWTYTALEQLKQQQEEEERRGSSFVSRWPSAHLVLQQRSSGNALHQRLLQAYRVRRLRMDAAASVCKQQEPAEAATCLCELCCTSHAAAAAEPKALLLLLPKAAPQEPQGDFTAVNGDSQEQQLLLRESAEAFKRILRGQLRRSLEVYMQQQQLQHKKALKTLPFELQQQLQLSSSTYSGLDCRRREPSSNSTSTCCWEAALAAASETELQPVELHAQHQQAHLTRLQRQQQQMQMNLLLSV